MTKISPELIQKTDSIFGRRVGGKISSEDARQSMENISGFFRVLQEWEEAERKERVEGGPSHPDHCLEYML